MKSTPELNSKDIKKKFKSNSSEIIIYKKKLFKKPFKKEKIKKEFDKQKIISEVLSSFKKIDSPEPKLYKDGIEYDFVEGIVFEKFYVKNLNYFSKSKKILKILDLIAEGLAKIHSEPINKDYFQKKEAQFTENLEIKKDDISLVHGDLNTENVICSEDDVTLIDPAPLKIHSFYLDLAEFIHFLKFKVPLKFFSLKSKIWGDFYKNYFLKRYSFHSKTKLDFEKLNEFKLEFAKNQKKMFISGKKHHDFKKRIIFKTFYPFLIMLTNIRIKRIEAKLK